MFGPRIKIEPVLYERLKKVAASAGYSTVDEFVTHLLEKATADAEQAESEVEIRRRLQHLGYID